MSKEQITDSPIKRRLSLGAEQPPETDQDEQDEPKHTNTKTQKHNNIITQTKEKPETKKEGEPMKRTTLYIPEDLALDFKVYAASHKQDMSGIMIQLIKNLLQKEK